MVEQQTTHDNGLVVWSKLQSPCVRLETHMENRYSYIRLTAGKLVVSPCQSMKFLDNECFHSFEFSGPYFVFDIYIYILISSLSPSLCCVGLCRRCFLPLRTTTCVAEIRVCSLRCPFILENRNVFSCPTYDIPPHIRCCWHRNVRHKCSSTLHAQGG